MGPAATCDFYAKLIAATPASVDQDHLPVVLWSDPRVPDRSEALLRGGEDPTPWLEEGATFLRSAGCELVAVPCNTAHVFVRRLGSRLGMPLVDMIEETVRRVVHLDVSGGRVGLLATSGTLACGLYQDELCRSGITTLVPPDQERVMAMIRQVKGGVAGEEERLALMDQVEDFVSRGAGAVILGCTELPVLVGQVGLAESWAGAPVLDPTRILAEAVVERAWRR